jgi:hypothetical protein
MRNLGKASLLAGAAALLAAPLAFAQATDAEFKCEAATSKAGAKFVGAKSKCVQKCLAAYWKAEPDGTGGTPEGDCLPPYAGATATCVYDPLKGAEGKYSLAILKACDPATKSTNDCPECYSGGDCSLSGHATNQVQNIEGQVDSFVPGVGCERPGADAGEQKCQTGTAKALTKQVGSVVKCYDKCKASERKGTIPPGSCGPPPSDAKTQECVNKGNTKTIAAIDKICGVGTRPDCGGTDMYPTGAQWVNLVDVAISGNVPTNYCE